MAPVETASSRDQSASGDRSAQIDQPLVIDLTEDLPRLVLFSDASTGKRSAAAILHKPPAGQRCRGRNIVQEMRCVFLDDGHLTSGALELAGMGISLSLVNAYSSAFPGQRFEIFVYNDSKPVVDFTIQEGHEEAGAPNLADLVAHNRTQIRALRSAGHVVYLCWASRNTQGMQRAHELAASDSHGTQEWPNNLYELVSGSAEAYAAATHAEREVMDNF